MFSVLWTRYHVRQHLTVQYNNEAMNTIDVIHDGDVAI